MEFLQQILAVCGGISIIGGAVAVIWKWIKPAINLNKRVEVLESHVQNDYEVLKKFSERDALILESMIAILDHQLTGDNIEELKKTRKKISEYLVHSQA